jgi:hypothetical protein
VDYEEFDLKKMVAFAFYMEFKARRRQVTSNHAGSLIVTALNGWICIHTATADELRHRLT